jgi:hypothetical protein
MRLEAVMETGVLEAENSWASQEILHILWDPRVHYRCQNSLLLLSIVTQMKPVHAVT